MKSLPPLDIFCAFFLQYPYQNAFLWGCFTWNYNGRVTISKFYSSNYYFTTVPHFKTACSLKFSVGFNHDSSSNFLWERHFLLFHQHKVLFLRKKMIVICCYSSFYRHCSKSLMSTDSAPSFLNVYFIKFLFDFLQLTVMEFFTNVSPFHALLIKIS